MHNELEPTSSANQAQARSGSNVVNMPAEAQEIDQHSADLRIVAEQRDKQVFARLFKHFAPLIKAYALSNTPSGSASQFADDLIQEVMLKVWNKCASFDPQKASASTWIFTIARNTRTDLIRRQARQQTPLNAEDLYPETEVDEPITSLQQRRSEKLIRNSLQELPSEQAQVLTKVFIEGKSHSEASEELGIPLGTIKSRVRLAMNKLQVLMERTS